MVVTRTLRFLLMVMPLLASSGCRTPANAAADVKADSGDITEACQAYFLDPNLFPEAALEEAEGSEVRRSNFSRGKTCIIYPSPGNWSNHFEHTIRRGLLSWVGDRKFIRNLMRRAKKVGDHYEVHSASQNIRLNTRMQPVYGLTSIYFWPGDRTPDVAIYRIQPNIRDGRTGQKTTIDLVFVFDEILLDNFIAPSGSLNSYSSVLPPSKTRGFRNSFWQYYDWIRNVTRENKYKAGYIDTQRSFQNFMGNMVDYLALKRSGLLDIGRNVGKVSDDVRSMRESLEDVAENLESLSNQVRLMGQGISILVEAVDHICGDLDKIEGGLSHMTLDLASMESNMGNLTSMISPTGFIQSMFTGSKKASNPFKWQALGSIGPPWAQDFRCSAAEVEEYKAALREESRRVLGTSVGASNAEEVACDGTGGKPSTPIHWRRIYENQAPYLGDADVEFGTYQGQRLFYYPKLGCLYNEAHRKWFHHVRGRRGPPVEAPVPQGIQVNHRRAPIR